jgi:N-acetylmuramoyl-L-alanine amidase
LKDLKLTRIVSLLLLITLIAAPAAARLTVRQKKQIAFAQFETAERMREALNGRPEGDRSLREYQRVIEAFRRVYYIAPTSRNADEAVVAIAELLAESGRAFDKEASLRAAIGQYEFLRREYPGSRYRFDALFTIAQIYKDDLNDSDKAKATFEEFLKQYPHHSLAADARAAIEELTRPPEKSHAAKEAEKKETPEKKPASILVTGIRHWSTPDYTRVAIDLQEEVKYEAGRVPGPDRIFFDLHGTRLASVLVGKSFEVEDGFLRKIRVAQFQRGRTRVVLEVDAVAEYSAFLLPNPYRLIVDIHGKQPAAKAARAGLPAAPAPSAEPAATTVTRAAKKSAEEPPPKPEKQSAAPVELARADTPEVKVTARPAGRPVTEAAQPQRKGRRKTSPPPPPPGREARPASNGQRSLIRALGLKIGRIVVDAGHGGHDTGTIGANGLQEKDLVLDVALRLGRLLEDKLGANVIYTREDDTFIPLETRTAVANQAQADLFISIHANSSDDPAARGVETYYLNFTSSRDALEVAARENAVSEKSIHELQDLVKKIALKEKIEESREFAADVQRSLHAGLAARTPAIRDRGVKKAPFIVLIGANMPSVLAEISFVSNPTDERRLRSAAYRKKIAEYLYRGISRYVGGLSGVKVASSSKSSKGSD